MFLDLCGYCRLPHMVTHPGTQAYHVNKLGTELALTALHRDMSLTKLIPRFQYPKFLPQFQVVASICSADAGGWMPGCETACTQRFLLRVPCSHCREGRTQLVWVVCMRGLTRELRKPLTQATQTKPKCPCLILSSKLSANVTQPSGTRLPSHHAARLWVTVPVSIPRARLTPLESLSSFPIWIFLHDKIWNPL